MSNNSKSYYNQPDYTDSGNDTSFVSSNQVIHKLDEATASKFSPPPPPYSLPENSSTNGGYDSIRNSIEQQTGLLSEDVNTNWKQNTPYLVDNYQQQSRLTRHEHSSTPLTTVQTLPIHIQNNPGCCRKWFKYIFLGILIWLIAYKYSDRFIGPSLPPNSICQSNAVIWKGVPRIFHFEKNLELTIEGRVSGGLITILSTDNEGMILTDIAMYPPELADQMTFMTNRDGETMQVVLRMPPEMAQRLDDECISVHLEIRIPSTIERFVMNVKNVEVQLHPSVTHVDHMEIKTSNGELAMKDWTGSILRLATTQGKLKVGRLVAEDSVMLENSNSMIVATDRVEAKREVQIKNVNGHIRASSEIYAHDTIFIESSNQAIQLGNIVADHVSIRTSNGKLFIDSIQAKTQILTQTSNAPISLSILGDKNNKVNVLTSNADINLHMPNRFGGRFVFSTSHGEVLIDGEDNIEYEYNISYLKQGVRKGTGDKGDLTVQTSNANVQVSFDV